MTGHQFALATRADEKWIHNAARLLGRRFRRTPEEARWLGLVRLVHESFGVPLAAAARMAATALAAPATERTVCVASSADGSATLVIDVARYLSSFAAALSVALTHASPRRRGRQAARPQDTRKALEAARVHGVDLGLLRASLSLTAAERLERLDENAAFIRAMRRTRAAGAPLHRPNEGRASRSPGAKAT